MLSIFLRITSKLDGFFRIIHVAEVRKATKKEEDVSVKSLTHPLVLFVLFRSYLRRPNKSLIPSRSKPNVKRSVWSSGLLCAVDTR